MAEGEPPTESDSTELAPTVAGPTPQDEPQRIGPYRLLQKLGEGGMGEVWLAEQSEPVRRRVALKVIKRGMDTEQVVARFAAERQALALMDHPAVAKVFEAGATERGRPYFVMEHVHGVPITEHCDRHKLTTRERLELFVQVCAGVQHAHQKAIIHRDLKPSNVLVVDQDGKRQPKIIDFGVAKATAQRLTEKTVYTELGVMIGTPEYMSPEQAELTGEDVDTRTDVYSLGVMLYELLVGALPFESKELRGAGLEGIQRKIREEEPRRPSARLSTLGDERSKESAARRQTTLPALRRQLHGELDWIVMKTLEKDRARRYGSPAELAADIERHLRNEPVLAGPPSAAYRARKFVRRHRLGVSVTIGLVLLLAGFTAMTAVQARRIAAERDRATQTLRYLKQVFEVSDPSQARGAEITARELLDKSAGRIAKDLAGQPELAAEMAATMGGVYRGLGLYDRAQPLLEDALKTRRRILGDRHPDTLTSIHNLGELLHAQGKLAEAESYYREAFEGRRRVLGNDHPDMLDSIDNLGVLLSDQGKPAEAEGYLREALEGRRRVLGNDHKDSLESINNLGTLLQAQGKLAEAESYFREALEGNRRVQGKDHPDTLNSINNLAVVLRDQGKLAEAEGYLREAIEGCRRVLGSDHLGTLEKIANLAAVLRDQGKLAEADGNFREALEGFRRVLGNDHPGTLTAIANLGVLLQAEGRLAEAESYSREALEGRRHVLGNDHQHTAFSLVYLASVLDDRARFEEAEPLAREALDILRKQFPAGHWRIALSQSVLGASLAGRRRYAEAESLLLEGEKGLAGSTEPPKAYKRKAVERLVALYAGWGRAADEARWREKLAALL